MVVTALKSKINLHVCNHVGAKSPFTAGSFSFIRKCALKTQGATIQKKGVECTSLPVLQDIQDMRCWDTTILAILVQSIMMRQTFIP